MHMKYLQHTSKTYETLKTCTFQQKLVGGPAEQCFNAQRDLVLGHDGEGGWQWTGGGTAPVVRWRPRLAAPAVEEPVAVGQEWPRTARHPLAGEGRGERQPRWRRRAVGNAATTVRVEKYRCLFLEVMKEDRGEQACWAGSAQAQEARCPDISVIN
jgi:hypothetical protein